MVVLLQRIPSRIALNGKSCLVRVKSMQVVYAMYPTNINIIDILFPKKDSAVYKLLSFEVCYKSGDV